MKPIKTARDVLARQTRALWSWRRQSVEREATPALAMSAQRRVRAVDSSGVAGLTSAQDLGFFARSRDWRCTSCGKLQRFAQQVPVVFASPCECASIEFEPQRGAVFAAPELPAASTELLLS